MKIIEHRLHKQNDLPYPYCRSPNRSELLKAEYIVLHYTAGSGVTQTVSWLTNPASKASAHLVIGRDGNITQMVPFNIQAWHAGISEWEGRTGLNQYALGIELDNAGPLHKHGNRWRSWFGQEYNNSDVIEAPHKTQQKLSGWHLYTPLQLQTSLEVCLLLFEAYNIKDIIGHDDIAPGRKFDPGPAFPMHNFRSRILGRRQNALRIFVTTMEVNIHSGAGSQHTNIQGGPLPTNTPVEILHSSGRWCFVDVLTSVNQINDLQGWVHGRYLTPASDEQS